MPPIVSLPPPPVPIEVISPRGTETNEATGSAETLASIPSSKATPIAANVTSSLVAPLSSYSPPAESLDPLRSGSFGDRPVHPKPKSLTSPAKLAVIPPPELAPFPTIQRQGQTNRESDTAENLDRSLPLPNAKRLVSQSRDDGEVREFIITAPSPAVPAPEESVTDSENPQTDVTPNPNNNPTNLDNEPEMPPEVVELIADRQEFDSNQQVVTATGNVTMRFANGILLADRLRVNLPDRFAVAEGNVTLK
ncbi:MAG: hypothetical protein ACK58N_16870, partial [Synechocystis sp.]